MNATAVEPNIARQNLGELTLLYHISRILDKSLDLRDVVSPVLEALADHMDMTNGTLTLLNRKTGDILTEVPSVRADVGYVPLVTPTSQIVGSQATFNVIVGRYQMVSNELKMLLRGEFGRTPAPANPDVVHAVLGPAEEPLRYRPASYLHPVLECLFRRWEKRSSQSIKLLLLMQDPRVTVSFWKLSGFIIH